MLHRHNEGGQDGPGYQLFNERVSLDAAFPVTCLAFGTGTPEKDLVKRDYWTLFDHSKDLILATGHTNGRIRIWDPYTGQYGIGIVLFLGLGSLVLHKEHNLYKPLFSIIY